MEVEDLKKKLEQLFKELEEDSYKVSLGIIKSAAKEAADSLEALEEAMMILADRYDYRDEPLLPPEIERYNKYKRKLEEEKVSLEEEGISTVKALVGVAVLYFLNRYFKKSKEIYESRIVELLHSIQVEFTTCCKRYKHYKEESFDIDKEGKNIMNDEWSGVNYHEIFEEYQREAVYNTRRDLLKWITAGMGIVQLKKIITRRKNDLFYKMSRTIKTEVNSLLNRTTKEYLMRFLSTDEYIYVSEDDSRVCKVCRKYDGKIYKEGKKGPIPPVHPNCRCYIIPHVIVS